jgi:MYXO-CTERM domain-containing protein
MLRFFSLCLFATVVVSAAEPAALGDIPSQALRDRIAALNEPARARALGTLGERQALLAQSEHLRVSSSGGLYFDHCLDMPAGPRPAAVAPHPDHPVHVSIPVANQPAYSSRPGAANTIFLDFNGHTVTGTAWNIDADFGSVASWQTVAFSIDGDLTTFNDEEQEAIFLIWQRVAEDYRTFNVNITTVEPATFGPRVGRCLITRSTDANDILCPAGDTAGGIAYINVFNDPSYTTYSPAWVYYDNLLSEESYIGEAVAHEVGHNMGLSHDRTASLEYYPGHGPAAFDWAPIMGAGYDRTVTQWSKGEYTGATNTEDDLSIIAGKLSKIADDFGGTVGTASALPLTSGSGVQNITAFTGLISSQTDVDVFSFVCDAGTINVTVTPFVVASTLITPLTPGGDLDVQIDLLDASGAVVSSLTANPQDSTSATLSGTISDPGQYFLSIRGAGNRNAATDGYSTYGSIGRYTVSGTTPVAPLATVGFVSANASFFEGNAGPHTISIPVTRSSGSSGNTSISYASADLTALAGSDYTAVSGVLTWADGDPLRKTITVVVNGDNTEEAPETFTLTLSSPSTGTVLTTSVCTVALNNDDGASATGTDTPKPHGMGGDSGSCGAGGIAGLMILVGGFLIRRRRI